MKPWMWILGILVVAWAFTSLRDSNDTEPAAVTAAVEEGHLTLLADKSTCIADPSAAKVYFFFTVRNYESSTVTGDVTPWRRYSDNSVNDSFMDTVTVEVPAGETKKFHADFGYNAEDHVLLECGLKLKGDVEPTMIPVS